MFVLLRESHLASGLHASAHVAAMLVCRHHFSFEVLAHQAAHHLAVGGSGVMETVAGQRRVVCALPRGLAPARQVLAAPRPSIRPQAARSTAPRRQLAIITRAAYGNGSYGPVGGGCLGPVRHVIGTRQIRASLGAHRPQGCPRSVGSGRRGASGAARRLTSAPPAARRRRPHQGHRRGGRRRQRNQPHDQLRPQRERAAAGRRLNCRPALQPSSETEWSRAVCRPHAQAGPPPARPGFQTGVRAERGARAAGRRAWSFGRSTLTLRRWRATRP